MTWPLRTRAECPKKVLSIKNLLSLNVERFTIESV